MKHLLVVYSFFAALFSLSFGQSCEVNIKADLPLKEPLYLTNSWTLWVPDGPNLTWAYEGSSRIICTGKNNVLTLSGNAENSIKCAGGTQFLLDGVRLNDTKSFQCNMGITGDLKDTGEPCDNGGTILYLGFNTSFNYIPYITVCYNMKTASVIWTKHVIPGKAIQFAMSTPSRPAFKVTGTPSHVKPATSYTQSAQLQRFTQLLGSEELAAKYIYTNSYLARGHITPDRDGIFTSWQSTTYFYVNVVPQWQAVNAGNWLRIENLARSIASTTIKGDIQVLTGAIDILKLPDVNGKEVSITLEEGGIETPKWTYKIIKYPNTDSGIAFVTMNNPFATKREYICEDICKETGFYNPEFDNLSKGFTYCCNVNDLTSKSRKIPMMKTIKNIIYEKELIKTESNC